MTRSKGAKRDSAAPGTLLAGLAQIARIASSAHGVRAAIARTAALRMNDYFTPAAADRSADQAMIVAFAVAGRRVEKINPEIARGLGHGTPQTRQF